MTGTGHYIAALGGGALIAAPMFSDAPLSAAMLAFGCASAGQAPDYLEIPYGQGRRIIPHRRITHWLLGWVVMLVAALYHLPHPVAFLATGFSIGGLIHLSGDAITPMGVPHLHPWARTKGPRWARSGGGWFELNWILMVLSVCAGWWLFVLFSTTT